MLTRHGVVRAAPTDPGTSRVRLPPASPPSYDWAAAKVYHLHTINKRLTAHHKEHIQPGPADRLHGPEITRQHSRSRRAEELGPAGTAAVAESWTGKTNTSPDEAFVRLMDSFADAADPAVASAADAVPHRLGVQQGDSGSTTGFSGPCTVTR